MWFSVRIDRNNLRLFFHLSTLATVVKLTVWLKCDKLTIINIVYLLILLLLLLMTASSYLSVRRIILYFRKYFRLKYHTFESITKVCILILSKVIWYFRKYEWRSVPSKVRRYHNIMLLSSFTIHEYQQVILPLLHIWSKVRDISLPSLFFAHPIPSKVDF